MSVPTEERKFLHDLASPLAAAIFTVDVLIEDHQAASGSTDLKSLERIQAALSRVSQLIGERRSKLLREQEVKAS